MDEISDPLFNYAESQVEDEEVALINGFEMTSSIIDQVQIYLHIAQKTAPKSNLILLIVIRFKSMRMIIFPISNHSIECWLEWNRKLPSIWLRCDFRVTVTYFG